MKLLIINSSQQNSLLELLPFFKELKDKKSYKLSFSLSNNNLLNQVKENKYKTNKLLIFNFKSNNFLLSIFSLLLFPISQLFILGKFLLSKNIKNSKAVILCSTPEKILFSLPTRIFKKKVIWLNFPGEKNKENTIQKILLKRLSSSAEIICFNDSDKINLEKAKYNQERLHILYLGIAIKNHTHQENIFSEIAETKKSNNLKSKFFTIGTIAELHDTKRIEVLFSAIKKCVTIIPNIQFIIVGDGAARKNLTWIAKKMEINNLVWFVGEQKNLRKWLTNFNIMIANCEELNLTEIKRIMEGMACSTPLIAPFNMGLEYLLEDGENGILVNMTSSEDISTQIIRIQQNWQLQKKLQNNAKITIDNFFKLDKMLGNFEKIIKQ